MGKYDRCMKAYLQLLSGKAGHPGRGSGGGFRELCGRGGRAAGKVTAKRNGDLP